MFDSPSYDFSRKVTEVREVTKHVHEHRAPTDDSIKMLKEMEEKTLDNILAQLKVGSTVIDDFEAVIHQKATVFRPEKELIFSFNIASGSKFKANNNPFRMSGSPKDIECVVTLEDEELKEGDIVEKITEKISEKLTEVMSKFVSEVAIREIYSNPNLAYTLKK